MTNPAFNQPLSIASLSPDALRLPLNGTVDGRSVQTLRQHLRKIAVAPRRLSLDCGSLQTIDPVGAALLWLLCLETDREMGTRITLLDVPQAICQKLRGHPLSEFLPSGEEIFQDPFFSPAPSRR